MISNKLYDALVKIQRFLPALGAAYLALAKVWGIPLGDEVNQTIAIIATLLGTFIEISITVYEKRKNGPNDSDKLPPVLPA